MHKPKARATAYRKELQRGCAQSAFTPHGWRSGVGKESQRGCRSLVAILAVPVRGKDMKLAAKEHVAAKERSADHRRM